MAIVHKIIIPKCVIIAVVPSEIRGKIADRTGSVASLHDIIRLCRLTECATTFPRSARIYMTRNDLMPSEILF